MFPFISSKKAAATQKMTATYGAPGTINEYLTLPSSSSPRPKSELAVIQRVYAKELRHDKQLAATIRKHIVTHWWKPFCESADTEQMREVLGFEPCEFDEGSVLDMGKVGYGKLVHSLEIAYMHIVHQYFGTDASLPGWTVRWALDKDKGPWIDVYNVEKKEAGECFGLMPPRTGVYDYKGELRALRRQRDAAPQVEGGEGNGHDSNWSIISSDSDEATSKDGNGSGYVHKMEDAVKPAKRGWLW